MHFVNLRSTIVTMVMISSVPRYRTSLWRNENTLDHVVTSGSWSWQRL